jgi:hypothetical protein
MHEMASYVAGFSASGFSVAGFFAFGFLFLWNTLYFLTNAHRLGLYYSLQFKGLYNGHSGCFSDIKLFSPFKV